MVTKCPKCQTDNPADSKYCKECATALPPSGDIPVSVTKTLETPVEGLTRGTKIAERYEVIEELGKGGMGAIYRVEDIKVKQEIALKLIKPEISSDKKTIERFRNELKTTRMISHRNVCRMFDLGEAEGTHFITMEYVPGEDLRSFIRRSERLDVGKTISIAKQICEGLSEAHRLGVVHRDLKSSNIMIDKEGNARIMDFGIARSLEAKGLTGEGMIIGTPEYMSPEQAEAKALDKRSDIYSLGIILYEMLTGQLPFQGDTPLAIAMKHKGETPKNPQELNPQISGDLSRLILKCLAKAREDRYQSADQVLSGLADIEKGIPTTQKEIARKKPLTSKEITVTFSAKKLLIPAFIIIAIAIVGLFLWRPWSKKAVVISPSDKPSIAILYFKNNTGEEELDHWRRTLTDSLIHDLSQSKHVYVLPEDRLFNILRDLDLLEAEDYSTDDLKEIAVRGNIENILRGNYSRAGDNFRINASIKRLSTEEDLPLERVEGKGEESFFSMVDELTVEIKASFKLSKGQIASDLDEKVGKITTSFPEAYRYYSEGRKHAYLYEHALSIPFYEKAVAIDPDFAMAYRAMWASYGNMGKRAKQREYLQKAFELRDKVSERERLHIMGANWDRGANWKNVHKCIEALEKLIELYPEDSTGRVNLASAYRTLEEHERAIEILEVAVQDETAMVYPYHHLSSSYRATGQYAKSEELLERYLKTHPSAWTISYNLVITYMCQGEYQKALEEAGRTLRLMPSRSSFLGLKGEIHHCSGNMIQAEKEYLNLLETDQRISGRERLGDIYLLLGKFELAREQFEQGISLAEQKGDLRKKSSLHLKLAYLLSQLEEYETALKEVNDSLKGADGENFPELERNALFYEGLIYAEMKSLEEAQKASEELRVLIEKLPNRKMMRNYLYLIGRLELEKDNFPKAIENHREAITLLPFQNWYGERHALFMDSLAFAYYESGDLDKAREEYTKITRLTIGKIDYGDIYAKSFYMLGKIHEEQGDKDKAIENYEKFFDLWKDADPGVFRVEDAKKRLSILKAH